MIKLKSTGRPWGMSRRAVVLAIVAGLLIGLAWAALEQDRTVGVAGSAVAAQADLGEPATEPSTDQPDRAELPDVPVPAKEPVPVDPGWSFEEQVYLDTLDMGDISYSSQTAALDAGWAICDFLEAGGSFFEASDIAMDSGGYSAYDAGYIVGAAQTALCPGVDW